MPTQTYSRRGWVAPTGHLTQRSLPSIKYLECRIRAFRRDARWQLLGLIRELETGLYFQAGGFFPVAARLTVRIGPKGQSRRQSVDGRGDKELLRRDFPCTRPNDFKLRYYEGGAVRGRFSIWSHNPCAPEMDELQEALGCNQGPSQVGTGTLGAYERFVEALGELRDMRREAYRMVSYGTSKTLLVPSCAEEAELYALLLPGTPHEAARRVRAELSSILREPFDQDELMIRREEYFKVVRRAVDTLCYRELIDTTDQVLLATVGLPDHLWQHVARRRAGASLVADVPSHLSDGRSSLAEVIEIGSRTRESSSEPILQDAVGAF